MSKTTYYQRYRDVILHRAKRSKDVLREKARNKYRVLSDEQKDIKRKYRRNSYRNMSEEDKQKLKEYQKNYHETKNQPKKFLCFFSLNCMKMESKALFYGGQCINKNVFHKKIEPIGINRIEVNQKIIIIVNRYL